ncbi:M48 family metallopeptidase [Halorussus salinus]|uniref:M48 family metallopeptidase n=1 Tax=Halorussus salinus TaxID=1364935 RepID=UPI001091D8EF|nr:M48 family metalloprotease [Halorussus salinus]
MSRDTASNSRDGSSDSRDAGSTPRDSTSNSGPPDDPLRAGDSANRSGHTLGLSSRIALTLALVLAADAAFVAVLAYLFRPWLAALAGDFASAGGAGAGSGVGWFALAALVAPATLALAWAQLTYTRREALAAADARPVSESERPDLHARVRRLAQTAGVSPPRVALAETDVANSFTVGDLRGGTVVVSTGLLDRLSDEEVDAVLAHELAHLQNRDAAVMTLATFLPALANDDYSLFSEVAGPLKSLALGVAALFGYAASTALVGAPVFSLESLLAFGGFVVFTALFGGVALGLLALPVAVLSGRLSRYREFAADRAGALTAGDPAAMASALATLDADAPATPTEDVRAHSVRELCFLPHGIVARGESADGTTGRSSSADDPLAGLPVEVPTHPPTAERIARLRDLAAEERGGYR